MPFTTRYLVGESCRVGNKGGQFQILIDFTHDISKEKFKLGAVSVIGHHYDENHGQNSQTMVPIAYVLADQETGDAYSLLLKFAHKCISHLCGVDFLQQVTHIFVDGHCSDELLKGVCPNAAVHRCVEHIKRNVMKNLPSGLGSMAAQWVEVSAFAHSPQLFSALWVVILRRFEGKPEFDKAVKYLTSEVVQQNTDGSWSAPWQSSLTMVDPGKSTFSSNTMESHWRVLALLHSQTACREVASNVFKEMEKDCVGWRQDKKFREVLSQCTEGTISSVVCACVCVEWEIGDEGASGLIFSDSGLGAT